MAKSLTPEAVAPLGCVCFAIGNNLFAVHVELISHLASEHGILCALESIRHSIDRQRTLGKKTFKKKAALQRAVDGRRMVSWGRNHKNDKFEFFFHDHRLLKYYFFVTRRKTNGVLMLPCRRCYAEDRVQMKRKQNGCYSVRLFEAHLHFFPGNRAGK